MSGANRALTRPILLAAITGFLSGGFVVSVVVWEFGNVIGAPAARAASVPLPTVVDRWGTDEAGADILEIGPASVPAIVRPAPGRVAVVPNSPAAPLSEVHPPVPAPVPTIGANPLTVLRARELQLPVLGVKADQLIESFSDRRGSGRLHEAIDIFAPRNTPVLAVDDGSIARLFYSKAGGITIYQFDPSEEFTYYYAHLERYAPDLREKDHVKRGQVIGYVGATGNAPPGTPHLHFAIFRLTEAKHWWEGSPIDPYEALK